MQQSNTLLAASDRIYRLLLIAYPDDFRHTYGSEMIRVFHDSCHNAIAHAGATQIEITLAALADRLTLTIADDGSGFDATRPRAGRASWGLAIMRERAEAVGATLRIDSAPARGTRVVVEMARSPA